MDKTEFLKLISNLSRDEIQKTIKEKDKTRKMIYPAVYICRDKKKAAKKDD
jgi:hypothetical protein